MNSASYIASNYPLSGVIQILNAVLFYFTITNRLRYSTANAESDYTDRDTDRETDKEGEREPEQESEEDEDKSCATVLTLRQEDSQEEGEEEEEEREQQGEEEVVEVVAEAPSGELALLLAQSDILHTGDASLKAEGFHLLLANKGQVSFEGEGPDSFGTVILLHSAPTFRVYNCSFFKHCCMLKGRNSIQPCK